jgi:hypothetical protein
MEAGTHSIWISEQLQELGHEVIVANVRELRAISHELARMEPSWHVLGPEPARFGPAPGQDRKSLAYERMQRFSTQIIRSPAMPQKFSGMLPHANAWQPTRKCAAH